MAETRLSKLQKWILDRIIENVRNEKYKDLKGGTQHCLYREEIYYDFFNLPLSKYGSWPKSKIVTVSRSLKNLEEKRFITILAHIRPKGCMIFLSEEYINFLNKQAKEKSLMLTKQVNNKKITKEVK